jgi:hypothetical protein
MKLYDEFKSEMETIQQQMNKDKKNERENTLKVSLAEGLKKQ